MKRILQRIRRVLPDERIQRADVIAGLSGAVASVPDGMAAGALAGVSPVHGLYASMGGRLFGSFATSTRLMVVTATSASALAAGSALTAVAPEQRSAALILLTLFAGCVMIAASILRLGRYTRFVSHSVMTGFLAGIAANIVFGQLAQLAGVSADSSIALLKAVYVVRHPGEIDIPSLVVGLFALGLLLVLARTRLRLFAALAALVFPTALMIGFGWDSVTRVADAGAIPKGFPWPHLPDLAALTPSLLGGAAAVSVIVLVQGAGVAQAVPNRDGSPTDPNRDFAAQGIGSLAAALFRGMPVGGSLGQTALNATAGAHTRSRRSCPGCGCWGFSSPSLRWSARCPCRRWRRS
ncbi:SulP family inorganic anion transporter [Nocardia sp. NPDC051750]|uniref:SulP family inorganic anion transporter n=1 Tax=Nocardia sp. NPDC051750 TaxID=3364325 RepID=UPI00379CEC82